MKQFVFSIVLCLGIQSLAQQKIQRLSLEEAISIGLKNNIASKNASLEIEAGKKRKWQAIAEGLPQLEALGTYRNFIQQQVSLFPASFADNFSQIRNLEEYYNITKSSTPIPAPPQGDIPVTLGQKQTISATATLSQLIFSGTYLVGLKSFKTLLSIIENTKAKTDLEVYKQIVNAYSNVLLLEESLKILKNNRINLEDNLAETRKIFETGFIEEEFVEQLQITLSQIISNQNKTRRLKDISYQVLNMLLGNSLEQHIELTDRLEDLAEKHIDIKLTAQKFSLEQNIDYLLAEKDTQLNKILLQLEKSKALPSLSAFINGGYNGNGNTFTFLNQNQNWFPFSFFGLDLKIPLFSSGKRAAATQRATINLEISKNKLSEVSKQIQLELAQKKTNYEYAIEHLYSTKSNLKLAKRIAQKNELKFKEGVGSSFEWREARMQLYSAQEKYLKAMIDIINSKVAYESVLKFNSFQK